MGWLLLSALEFLYNENDKHSFLISQLEYWHETRDLQDGLKSISYLFNIICTGQGWWKWDTKYNTVCTITMSVELTISQNLLCDI